MRRRAVVVNLLIGLVALILGVVAQYYFKRNLSLGDGLILYAVAVILFLFAFGQKEEREEASATTPLPQASRNRSVSMLLFYCSALAIGLSLFLFGTARWPNLAWAFFLSSVVLFAAGAYGLERNFRWPQFGNKERGFWISWPVFWQGFFLVAILAVALFLRLYKIDSLPFGLWYDEADNGIWARSILADSNLRPVYAPSTNLPSPFLYLIAFSFKLFGEGAFAVRLVTIASGVLTAVLLFFLLRLLFNPKIAVVGAFLMAVSSWNVNFSRIGLHGVTTPLFEVLALYLLFRALRSRRLFDYALSGIALGFGLWFYAAFRLFPLVVLLLLLHKIISERGYLRQSIKGVGLLMAGGLLVLLPLFQYAIMKPEIFFSRTATTSVFRDKTPSEAAKAVLENTKKHFLMFNYKGDNNGRHHLPGEPMLDFGTSILAVMGFAYSLYRWRQTKYFTVAVGFLIMLTAGILSLDFEAPQSNRAIGVMPFAYIFAAIALDRVWQTFGNAFRWRGEGYLVGFLIVILGVIGYNNYDTYFNRLANDFGAWSVYSTAETVVGNELRNLDQNEYDFYLSPLFVGHLTVRFLSPQVTNHPVFDEANGLPLQTNKRGIVLFLEPRLDSTFRRLKEYYPAAGFQEIKQKAGVGPTILYIARIRKEDVTALQGLSGRYYPSSEDRGEWEWKQKFMTVDFDFGKGRPAALPFNAEWSGILRVPQYGKYTLRLDGPSSGQLYLDDSLVLDGSRKREAQLTLAKGNYPIRLAAKITNPSDKVRLFWRKPGAAEEIVPAENLFTAPVVGTGLLGRYFAKPDWSGEPDFERVDSQVGYYFHLTPLSRPYSVEWIGRLIAPVTGVYRLGTESISFSQLFIDGRELLSNPNFNQTVERQVELTQGVHEIRVRFQDKDHFSHVYLYWAPPGRGWELIPSANLRLPESALPRLAVGN